MRNIGNFKTPMHSGLRSRCFPTIINHISGGDNNLAVTMGVYQPRIQCRGRFDEVAACTSITIDMPATKDLEIFGPAGTPDLAEILPQLFSGCEFQYCIGVELWCESGVC